MSLVTRAALAITDSGGLQEETTYLNIPCLTVRPNTERPITITEGTNRLVAPARPAGQYRQGPCAASGLRAAGRRFGTGTRPSAALRVCAGGPGAIETK